MRHTWTLIPVALLAGLLGLSTVAVAAPTIEDAALAARDAVQERIARLGEAAPAKQPQAPVDRPAVAAPTQSPAPEATALPTRHVGDQAVPDFDALRRSHQADAMRRLR